MSDSDLTRRMGTSNHRQAPLVTAPLLLVLGTGSRTWPTPHTIHDALLDTWHDATQLGYQSIEVMEGGADGADRILREWALVNASYGVRCQRIDADWTGPCTDTCPPRHRRQRPDGRDYCPFAGHRRNQHMVNLAATRLPEAVCLAFQHRGSTGTADCMERAKNAGVPVRLWTA